jgi:DNA repair exonuclease SbcCD ATPase subunit
MLNKVLAKNFLSWKDLSFNVVTGVTMLDGFNKDDQTQEGCGKSAVLNSVCWGVFGKIPKDANIDDVIKDGEESCEVTLEFSNGDYIFRSRGPNELYLMSGNEKIKGKDLRETQKLIEDFVGCNFETFCQSTYFAQNYDKKFLSANQEDKGKLLSNIQNLQVFDKARTETMNLLKRENENLIKLESQLLVSINNVNNSLSNINLIQSFIDQKIQKHNEFQQQLTSQKNSLETSVLNTQTSIDSLNEKLSSINLSNINEFQAGLLNQQAETQQKLSNLNYLISQKDSIKKQVASKESEGQRLANKYDQLLSKIEMYKDVKNHPHYNRLLSEMTKYSQVESGSEVVRLKKKQQEILNFIENPSKICPSCGSELKNIDLSHMQLELTSVESQIQQILISAKESHSSCELELSKLSIEMTSESSKMEAECQQILSQVSDISQFLDENKLESDGLMPQLNDLNSELTRISTEINSLNSLKLEHSMISSNINSQTSSLNSYKAQLDSVLKNIELFVNLDLKEDYDKLESSKTNLSVQEASRQSLETIISNSKLYITRLETLKDGFKEIKSFVFNTALNELNYRTQLYLNKLFEVPMSIRFTNDDQKIECEIKINNQSRGLGLLSGGQNRRANLAVDLALSDIVSYRKSSKLNLLVFDEYFKDLSEVNMEKCLNLLKEKKCPILLVEHNSIFKNIVDNVFYMELENGTTSEAR